MFKKIVILGLLSILITLTACKNVTQYNAKLYDDAREWIYEEFLIESLTRGAYYEGHNTDSDLYPKNITLLINNREEFDNVFDEFPFEVDFNKSMICLYIFTYNYIRPYEINKINIENNIVKILVESTKPKGAIGDSVRSWQRCLVVKMDKLEINAVEFIEK